MANSVYDPKTGDLVNEREQLKKTNLTKGFNEINYTDVNQLAQQPQIAPRQVRTGEMRGDMQLRGALKAQDRNGRIVAAFGFLGNLK
jgi:hypothetical protein|nr:MAG TPA: hypothetical protein [Caudoviricetes sp.]